MAKRVSSKIHGFVITTRFKPKDTVEFMHQIVARYPEIKVYKSDVGIPDKLYETDPDRCCDILKRESARARINAINEDVEVITYDLRFTSENILDIIKDYDICYCQTRKFWDGIRI